MARPIYGLALCACAGGVSEGVSDTAQTRSALGAASGVTGGQAANDPQGFRVVPLGPMRGDVEILYGHPDSAGQPFVMRIRELAGTVVPPHSHPVDEHITVLQGTWYFAVGEQFDSTALRALTPGSYAFAPAGATMFAFAPDPAVVQVHGIGPFHIRWRDGAKLLDEPGAATVFRFTMGTEVTSPRGSGRIRQGYASGALVQYEIEGAGGERFMVREHELRPR